MGDRHSLPQPNRARRRETDRMKTLSYGQGKVGPARENEAHQCTIALLPRRKVLAQCSIERRDQISSRRFCRPSR